MLGRQTRFQHLPQAQRHVRILRRIGAGLVDRHTGKADKAFALPGNLAKLHRLVGEIFDTHLIHAMAVDARVQNVGHQHGVIDWRHFDAVLGQHQPVKFHVLRDFQHTGIFQQRLQARQHIAGWQLAGQQIAAAKQVRAASIAMSQRNIGRPARRESQRNADKLGLHRVQRGCFGIHADQAGIFGGGYPQIKFGQTGDRGIGGIIKFGIFRRRQPLSGQILRGQPGTGLFSFSGWRSQGLRSPGKFAIASAPALGPAKDRVSLNFNGIDAINLGHPLGQRRKFHGFQKSHEFPPLGLDQ